jgi:SAM-dependent methyltransferase
MQFPPSQLALKYCRGRGLELGGASQNPFCLSNCLNVAPSDGQRGVYDRDLTDYLVYARHQQEQGERVMKVDQVGDFVHLPAADGELDYLVSSHVIEHEPNPLQALTESYRALKAGGVFFCIFPKRGAEPQVDAFRRLTTLQEFVDIFRAGLSVPDCHPQDGAPLGIPILERTRNQWRTHYHVYSLQSMIRLVNWFNQNQTGFWLIEAVEETDSKVGNGHTVVLRKTEGPQGASDAADEEAAIAALIDTEEFEAAYLRCRAALSTDFFRSRLLYTAGLLGSILGHRLEGREFMRQALVVDPEDETVRRDFYVKFSERYTNPLA